MLPPIKTYKKRLSTVREIEQYIIKDSILDSLDLKGLSSRAILQVQRAIIRSFDAGKKFKRKKRKSK